MLGNLLLLLPLLLPALWEMQVLLLNPKQLWSLVGTMLLPYLERVELSQLVLVLVVVLSLQPHLQWLLPWVVFLPLWPLLLLLLQ